MLIGLATALSYREVKSVTAGLVILAVVLALIGIIQRATFTGRIYGFWTPVSGLLPPSPHLGPFGPFINRNHFAGWMLMALPLAMGYFAELITKGVREKQGFRNRVLWFASAAASRAILVQFAILIMGLSLVMTISRSGITSFAITLIIIASWLARRSCPVRC